MQHVEHIVLAVLIAAVLSVMIVTIMMLFALNGADTGAFETAVLVLGRMGGGA